MSKTNQEHNIYYNRLYNAMQFTDDEGREKFRALLNEAISHGFPIDYPEYGQAWNLLQHAVQSTATIDNGALEILLKAGVNPNAKVDSGWTALLLCVDYGKPPKAVKLLLDAGADVNYQMPRSHRTAFDMAAKNYISGYRETSSIGLEHAKLLLKYGSDPYLCHTWKKTSIYTPLKIEEKRRNNLITIINKILIQTPALQNQKEEIYEYEL